MELWDAYDRLGNPLGALLSRGEPIPEGMYHMVCSVLVLHKDGTYLLMKRHPNKPTWPNVYEASAGGSALAGETALCAAKRELAEETGITSGDFSPLYDAVGRNAIYRGFLCVTDWDKRLITLQEGETVAFCWVTEDELRRWLQKRPHEVVMPTGAEAWLNGAPVPVHVNENEGKG